jgi:aspartyl-tRNA(Asn)/glutamyl-tRNA(Gln) amidotransferase subunit A
MTDLVDLGAVGLARAYEAGDASPREALEAVRARIEAWEPTINALWHRDDAAADRQAVASEARWRSGEPLSPLDGVPVTIKENITTAGVRALSDRPRRPSRRHLATPRPRQG